MNSGRPWSVAIGLVLLASASAATMIPGGGPKKTDCILQLSATGAPFPGGVAVPAGATCYDGGDCDQDGLRNGVCTYSLSLCINTPADALPKCKPTDVKSLTLKGSTGKSTADTGGLEAAVAELNLPSSSPTCTTGVTMFVPVGGPDKKGQPVPGKLKIKAKAHTSKGKVDKDEFQLVCLPSSPAGTLPPTTTTTLPPGSLGTPGAGLQAEIVATTIAADGTVTVTFTLTDASNPPIVVQPQGSNPTDSNHARVRFTIARLDIDHETLEGNTSFSSDFTRYRNYITTTAMGAFGSSPQPGYDSGGTFALADVATGTWTYTFKKKLPTDLNRSLTHTVGAQVERTFEGASLVANPVFDFVPDGGSLTMRELTTTAECNSCHGQLAVHGGGRREVRLCQLCHTDQAIDPDSGNSIDFKVMIHKIHRGKDLPSIAGAVGLTYEIIGFQGSHVVFGDHVKTCSGGTSAAAPCASDADCPGGTCTGNTTVGVGFPQDLRNCEKCHGQGATAADYRQKPSAPACQSCHDDINPGTAPLFTPDGITYPDHMIPGGTRHGPDGMNLIGAKPDVACQLCHVATGAEFDISVPGAHTIPTRSAQLGGLKAQILSATGAPGGAVSVTFRVTDGSGTPLPTVTGKVCSAGANISTACTTNADCPGASCVALSTLSFALSGPTTDLGGAEVRTCTGGPSSGAPCTVDADCTGGACTGVKALINPAAIGGSATGTLAGPDASGNYSYTMSAANALPASASGTWRIGLEARRTVPVNGANVTEAAQNPVLDFSVDGSPVVARREVVDVANCSHCHGTFSVDFSVHGGLRNQTEYCVICHNPNVSDFARRSRTFCAVTCGTNKLVDTTAAGDDVQLIAPGGACASSDTCAVAVGPDGVVDTAAAGDDGQRVPLGIAAADAHTETIHLKRLIHRIHTGEEGETQPYVVYGFGAAPANFTPNDFGDVLYPRDRRDCAACHVNDSHLLPLPDGVIPTRRSMVELNPDASKWATAPFVEGTPVVSPPVQTACLACHDAPDAAAHAQTQTTPSGAEACGVCHEEGKIEAVSEVHALP